MNAVRIPTRTCWALLLAVLVSVAATGCQTTVGGQTLPSAYYLLDDVQYFPKGPETPLFNQRQKLEEYRLGRQALRAGGFDQNAPQQP